MSKLFPELRDCHTRDIRGVLKCLAYDLDVCAGGDDPSQRTVLIALMHMLDNELRFRDPRRGRGVTADGVLRRVKT